MRTPARRQPLDRLLLAVLVLQGLHTAEHLAQWLQHRVLRWPSFAATGLVPPPASEWLDLLWSWGFLLACAYLAARGVQGPWMWALLVWAGAHAAEHTYLIVRYTETLRELRAMGTGSVRTHELPGILGRDGWLATRGAALARIPGLTTALRLDIHLWWNVGALALLLPATSARRRSPPNA